MPRRVVAAALLSPPLLVALTAAGGGWAPGAQPAWTAVVGLASGVGATTLASYLPLPGAGRRLDVGCTSCAAAAALSVVAAAAILSTAPHQLVAAVAALGVAALGLRQRMLAPAACATGVPADHAS